MKIPEKLYRIQFRLRHYNKYYFILRHLFTDTDKLKVVAIETTTYCNRKCVFCPLTFDNTPPKYMDTSLFYKILDDLDDMAFDGEITMSHYGEPLLDKRLLKFIKDTKNRLKNVRIKFFTNGDMLTPKKAMEFLRNGTDLIYVTQHDLKPSKQIKRLERRDWKGKIRFGIANINSKWMSNRGGSVDIDTFNPMYCLLDGVIIRVDGTAPLCCNDYYKEVTFGSVKDKSIEEIWNSKRFKIMRKSIKRGKFNLEICKRCRGEIDK